MIPQPIWIPDCWPISPANKANPDPTKLVKWGPQTYDEMMIGYVEYFTPIAGAKVATQ